MTQTETFQEKNPAVGPNDAAMLQLAIEVDAKNQAGIAAGQAAAKGAAAAQAAPASAAPMEIPAIQPKPADRPGWLPEKFKSPEDMAAAYKELETKLSGAPAKPIADPSLKPAETPAAPTAAITDAEMAAFTQEFNTTGALSDASYKALEAKGLKREVVTAYVDGQKAQANQAVQTVYASVGGEANYKAATEWARDTLTADELTAYNTDIQSGNVARAQAAAAGVYARFRLAGGRPADAPPAHVHGKQPAGGASAVQPFRSQDEVLLAMAHPLYKHSQEYRDLVMERVRAGQS